MKRIERLIKNVAEHVDFRYPDWKTDALLGLQEYKKLLELVEEKSPETYIAFLQWFHDNN